MYTGELKDDQTHGYGFTQYADSDPNEAVCHFGMYAEDRPNGLGAILHKDGYLYSGEFKEGKIHGKGLCRGADASLNYGAKWKDRGRVYRGEMRAGVMWAEYEGKWAKGKLRGQRQEAENSQSAHSLTST